MNKGFFVCVLSSVLVNQPTVHRGEFRKGKACAIAVSVGDRGKVICDM